LVILAIIDFESKRAQKRLLFELYGNQKLFSSKINLKFAARIVFDLIEFHANRMKFWKFWREFFLEIFSPFGLKIKNFSQFSFLELELWLLVRFADRPDSR
jgi:hypothetical protein